MKQPFRNSREVEKHLSAAAIECLECGRRFEFLPVHLIRVHGLSAEEYRAAWSLPAGTPLAGTVYRAKQREKLRHMQRDGRLTYDHLPRAVEASRGQPRQKGGVARTDHSDRVKRARPGDHHKLPAGAKRTDGRNADNAREYQRQYRRLKSK